MTVLEQKYRHALKWYPASWRRRNEDAVIGTLLDSADGENRNRPRPLELANLASHGFISRLRLIPIVIPVHVRDRASAVALSVGAAIALSATMQLESVPTGSTQYFGVDFQTFGQFASPAILIYAAWILAFFSAMAGFATAARGIALATMPLSFVVRAWADSQGMMARPTWSFMALLILLAVLVAAGTPGSTRTSVRWMVGWFLPAVLVFLIAHILTPGASFLQEPRWLGRPDIIAWFPVIAVSLAAILHLANRAAWASAVLLIGVPFTAAALMGSSGVLPAAAQASAVIAVAVLCAVAVLRILRIRVRLERAR